MLHECVFVKIYILHGRVFVIMNNVSLFQETFRRNYVCNVVKRQRKQGKYSDPGRCQELSDSVLPDSTFGTSLGQVRD